MLIAIVGAFPIFGTRSMSDKFSFPNSSMSAAILFQPLFVFLANTRKKQTQQTNKI